MAGVEHRDRQLRQRRQAIGVPVFAVLDGRVTQANDGEQDMHTSGADVPANFVVIDHGDTHQTLYWHLKRGSVRVAAGETVVAGQQIGDTASSGSSTWPHLHFETRYAGSAFEPSAGPCRPGPSLWARQTPIRRELYARVFTFSAHPFLGAAGLPLDQAVRTRSFQTGVRTVYFRFVLANQPANSTYRVRFLRPQRSAGAGCH